MVSPNSAVACPVLTAVERLFRRGGRQHDELFSFRDQRLPRGAGHVLGTFCFSTYGTGSLARVTPPAPFAAFKAFALFCHSIRHETTMENGKLCCDRKKTPKVFLSVRYGVTRASMIAQARWRKLGWSPVPYPQTVTKWYGRGGGVDYPLLATFFSVALGVTRASDSLPPHPASPEFLAVTGFFSCEAV